MSETSDGGHSPLSPLVHLIDDDEAVRDSLQWLLEGKDYRVKAEDYFKALPEGEEEDGGD